MELEFANKLGLKVEDIDGETWAPHLTIERFLYWWTLRYKKDMTAKEIRRHTGRSYSYIMKGIKYIDDAIEMDDAEVLRLMDKLAVV